MFQPCNLFLTCFWLGQLSNSTSFWMFTNMSIARYVLNERPKSIYIKTALQHSDGADFVNENTSFLSTQNMHVRGICHYTNDKCFARNTNWQTRPPRLQSKNVHCQQVFRAKHMSVHVSREIFVHLLTNISREKMKYVERTKDSQEIKINAFLLFFFKS